MLSMSSKVAMQGSQVAPWKCRKWPHTPSLVKKFLISLKLAWLSFINIKCIIRRYISLCFINLKLKCLKRTKIQIKVRQHQKLSFLYKPANDYFVHVTMVPKTVVSHIETIRRHSQYKSSLNLVF